MENNINIDELCIYIYKYVIDIQIENISPCPQDPDAKEGDLDRWARGLRDDTTGVILLGCYVGNIMGIYRDILKTKKWL